VPRFQFLDDSSQYSRNCETFNSNTPPSAGVSQYTCSYDDNFMLSEPILLIFGLGQRENYVLSRGAVFVVFPTSAFCSIFELELLPLSSQAGRRSVNPAGA